MPTPEAFAQLSDPKTDIGPSNFGPDLASAGSPAGFLSPTHRIHNVTGNSAITNINPPYPGYSGTITFIAAAGSAWTWTAAGTDDSIAIASAAAPSVGKAVHFTRNPNTKRWHPSSTVAA